MPGIVSSRWQVGSARCQVLVGFASVAQTQCAICRSNSLLLPDNSLFFELVSLLAYVGNCPKSRCGSAASCSETASCGLRIVNFPVKFPVTREFLRRPVRSALRRQPIDIARLNRFFVPSFGNGGFRCPLMD